MYTVHCTLYTNTIISTKHDAQSLNLKTEYRNETWSGSSVDTNTFLKKYYFILFLYILFVLSIIVQLYRHQKENSGVSFNGTLLNFLSGSEPPYHYK